MDFEYRKNETEYKPMPSKLEDWLNQSSPEIGKKYEVIYDLDFDELLNKPYINN